MASIVQICNLALASIGSAEYITSLSDPTSKATICNLLYEDTAKEVMMAGTWASTVRRANLGLLTTTPEYGYSYEFQLPENPECLKVLDINDLEVGSVDYAIEGSKLLIDQSSVKIRYIAYIEDSGSYDEYLKEAIVAKLASKLAVPVTGDKRLSEAKLIEYTKILEMNLAKNNQQGSIQTVASNDLINVRSK